MKGKIENGKSVENNNAMKGCAWLMIHSLQHDFRIGLD